MADLFVPPLARRLSASTHVLIAGAGRGFDVHAGPPVAIALHNNASPATPHRY